MSLALPRRLALMTPGLRQVETLAALMDDATLLYKPQADAGNIDAVLAWGRKPSAEVAERFAFSQRLPLLRIEDGFLRSVGLGHQAPPLSLVVDDLGIYYDASRPSRLEHQISADHDAQQLERARRLRHAWVQARVSKYNAAREMLPPEGRDGSYVLVVDQTAGDSSIAYGLADGGSFARMFEAALDEHPEKRLLLKVHPDVVSGRKRGHFSSLTPGQAARVSLLASAAHPCAVLEAASAVYVVSSQMGFEALLWDKPVRCFGMPFYAGWGLTQDALAAPDRRGSASLDALVHGALIDYPRYLDPETKQRCAPERLLAWMALQRRMRERFPPSVQALGFSRWKKPIVRSYFAGSEVQFLRRPAAVTAGATLAVWGRREPVWAAGNAPGEVIRLEDGFLRSVGLGADLVSPLSWVMDRSGIYYDATRPSQLESLLQSADFDTALLARARALRERILSEGVTKYNVGAGQWQRPPHASRVILVPGQVESDASIALGAPGVRRNIDLLRSVRLANPQAHLIYKPHPDVVAGLRQSGESEDLARSLCDELVVDVPMHKLIEAVDEVHVLTSLAGFEALLRGRKVVCHGCPFYAGWGLTTDQVAMARRSRRLSLDQLVAGALIAYPVYVSHTTGCFTTPERTLDEIGQLKLQGIQPKRGLKRLIDRLIRLFNRRR